MVKITPGVVIGAVATTAAVGLVGYAACFDYERRHNPEFRRRLLRDQHRQRRAAEVQSRRAQANQQDALRSAVREMRNERPFQGSAEEKEGYFLEQVAMGEALAARGEQWNILPTTRRSDGSDYERYVVAGPAFFVPAAISFFKALQVYPQPQVGRLCLLAC